MDQPAQDIKPQGVELYDFEDHAATRKQLFNQVKEEFAKAFPLSRNGVTIKVANLAYDNEDDETPERQYKAIMSDSYLAKRLRGDLELYDDATGQKLDERKSVTFMRVPWITERGTIIHNGSDYTTAMQSRLLPGAYTRRQESGQLETHFNTKMGTGPGIRLGFDPATAEYRLKVRDASNVHFYSVAKDLGVSDEEFKALWGEEVWQKNAQGYDPKAVDRVFNQIARKGADKEVLSREDKIREIRTALQQSKISKFAASQTLPTLIDRAYRQRWRLDDMIKTAAAAAEKLVGVSGIDALLTLRKSAAFGREDLLAVATLLNRELQAGIPVDGVTATQLEEAIMAFITKGNGPTQPGIIPSLLDFPALMQKSASVKIEAFSRAFLEGRMTAFPEEFDIVGEMDGLLKVAHGKTGSSFWLSHALVPQVLVDEWDEELLQVKSAKVAFDLDGTLAYHDADKPFDPDHVGAPIPDMLAKWKEHVESGDECIIFTARAADRSKIKAVRKWAEVHGLGKPEITNRKTPDLEMFYDDRAKSVVRNTGHVLGEKNDAHLEKHEQAMDATEENVPLERAMEGDYEKGEFKWNGLTIRLENKAGSIRRGKGWSIRMKNSYGEIVGFAGKDGDMVDVFVGPELSSQVVTIVNQKTEENPRFDEVKVMVGFPDKKSAVKAYHDNYTPGWKGFKSAVTFTVEQFKQWLKKHADKEAKPAKI